MNKLIVISLFMVLLLVGNVYAFGETKDFVKDGSTSKYGKIIVKNNFGLPLISKTIAEIELLENTDQCLTDCHALLEFTLFEDNKLFDKIKTKKHRGELDLTYQYYLETKYNETYRVPINEICYRDLPGNESGLDNSYPCSNSYETKTRERTEFKLVDGKEKLIGSDDGIKYQLLINGNKPLTDPVDWILEFKGLELDNWAWWDTDWQSKTIVTNLNNSVGYPLVDYPANITINGTYLIESGLDASAKDFRVVQNNIEIPYYNFTSFNRGDANIVIKVNLTEYQNDTTIELYYNNPSAVFPHYNLSDVYSIVENFENGDNWNVIAEGSFSFGQGNASATGLTGGGNKPDVACYNNLNLSTGFVFDYKMGSHQSNGILFYFNETGTASNSTWNNSYFTYGVATTPANQPIMAFMKNYDTGASGIIQQFNNNFSGIVGIGNAFLDYKIQVEKPDFTSLVYNLSVDYGNGSVQIATAPGTTTLPSFSISDRNVYGTSGTLCLVDTGNEATNYSNLTLYQKVNFSLAEDLDYNIPRVATPNEGIVLDLLQPLNNSAFNETDMRFEMNIQPTNVTLQNATIYAYQHNATTYALFLENLSTLSGTADYVYNFTFALTDGLNWSFNLTSCGLGDSTAIRCTNTGEISFDIDSSTPSLELHSPLVNLSTLDMAFNVTLNYTASGGALQSCWYNTNDNSTLAYFTCNTSQLIEFQNGSQKTISYYANNTFGSVASGTAGFFINHVRPSLDYIDPVIEDQNTTFTFNITADNIYQANVSLDYNSTKYQLPLFFNNETLASFKINKSAPLVDFDTNGSFNLSYYVNGDLFNTSEYSQYIYNIPNLTFGSCSPAGITYNLVDEVNLSDIAGTFSYNFEYGTAQNNTLVKSYGTITNANSFSVCGNQSISSNWFIGYGEIQYTANGWVDRRNYVFENREITNETTINTTLYALESTAQTSFQLEIEQPSLTPYNDVYASLIRWYPALDQYNVVGMGLTDENGNTIIHVVAEDVDYLIGVYEKNGTLIKLTEATRFVCLVTPCTYTLQISEGVQDLTSWFNIQYTFDYDYSTSIWTFTYSDASLITEQMNLTIYKDTGNRVYQVCNDLVSGASGTLTCNTSGQVGSLKGKVVRLSSPGVTIAEKFVSILDTPFQSTWGLFLTILIGIPIVLVLSTINPIAGLIGAIIMLIPALYFGSINWIIVAGFIGMVVIVIHFIKRIS